MLFNHKPLLFSRNFAKLLKLINSHQFHRNKVVNKYDEFPCHLTSFVYVLCKYFNYTKYLFHANLFSTKHDTKNEHFQWKISYVTKLYRISASTNLRSIFIFDLCMSILNYIIKLFPFFIFVCLFVFF